MKDAWPSRETFEEYIERLAKELRAKGYDVPWERYRV